MKPNEQFAKLAGVPWHGWVKSKGFAGECICGGVFNIHQSEFNDHTGHKNADYAADPRLVLEAMMKRKDWPEFLVENGSVSKHGRHLDCILIDYIMDKTGKLRDTAIEFINKTKGE
jgi:hypothetical protein